MSADLPEELQDVEVSSQDDDARGPDTDHTDGDGGADEVERFVVFTIGDRRLAVSVDAVKSIVKVQAQTRVPRSSGAIDGITDLRGEITAIIDARALFPTRAAEPPESDQRIIVFDMPSDRQSAGLRVDVVEGVELFPLKHLQRSEDATDEPADHPLVAAVLHRVEDGEHVDPIGLLDVDGVIEASGEVTA